MKKLLALMALLSYAPVRAECPQFFSHGQAPAAGHLLCNSGYAVGYSDQLRSPLWAAEHLSDDSVAKAQALHGRTEFYPDYRLPDGIRTDRDDYRGGAYARGHQAPSGDMPDWPTRTSTYLYSNVVPQDSEMNSGPWNQIEQATRQAALDDGELYVVTGPIFTGPVDRTAPNGPAIPTAMFKVVYDVMDGGVSAIQCVNDTPAQCRLIGLSELEREIGFDPLPGLSDAEKSPPLTIDGWAKAIRRSQN